MDNALDYQTYKETFANYARPFAYVNLDLLDDNINQVLRLSGDKSIRIASKSLRSIDIIKYILKSSSRFQGVMCYCAQEALMLAQNGLDDLLIAYPTWNNREISLVCEAIADGHLIVLTVDDYQHVERISQIAHNYNIKIPICIDIDMSTAFPGLYFGVHRSPVKSTKQVLELVNKINTFENIYVDGLLGYEAQIAGVIDNYPGRFFQNLIIRQLKKISIKKIAQKRNEIVNELKKNDITLRFFNGGGTGSILQTVHETAISEITVGSAFYNPLLFDYYKDFAYNPAAGFAVEITRQSGKSIYTCAGGGYIASGAVGKEKQPQIILPKSAKLLSLEGAGEVQTPIRHCGNEQLNLGDPIFMRHSKAGELCERFSELLCVRDNKVVGSVNTYRGDGFTFI